MFNIDVHNVVDDVYAKHKLNDNIILINVTA